jgi:YD repeat-containing protein
LASSISTLLTARSPAIRKGFDGSAIRVSKQYDSLGRVSQQSRPYFAASGTQQLTIYTYDVLNRVVTTTCPDGSTSKNAYHGRSRSLPRRDMM